MRIDEILAERPVFSVEFFPPKTAEATEELFATARELRELEPDFVSVTYGAGGSTREGTVEITKALKDDLGFETMAHLSCVGETAEGLAATLDRIAAAGIENVFALRGDPPRGQEDFDQPEGGLGSAAELAAFIAAGWDFTIGGACFPEVHPEAPDLDTDLSYLKTKVEAGASFLITQLFFDNQVYFDFVAAARARGIDVPILAGVIPVAGFAQTKRICELCDATIPPRLEAGVPGLRRRRAGRVRAGRRLRGAAVRGAADRRGAGDPLLRAEPGAGDARRAGRAAGVAALGADAWGGRSPCGSDRVAGLGRSRLPPRWRVARKRGSDSGRPGWSASRSRRAAQRRKLMIGYAGRRRDRARGDRRDRGRRLLIRGRRGERRGPHQPGQRLDQRRAARRARPGPKPPPVKVTNLEAAAKQAGCVLRLRLPGRGAQPHPAGIADPALQDQPADLGNHVEPPYQQADGAYSETPLEIDIVHSLEHGRMEIQYSPKLPERDQLALKGALRHDVRRGAALPQPTDALRRWRRRPGPTCSAARSTRARSPSTRSATSARRPGASTAASRSAPSRSPGRRRKPQAENQPQAPGSVGRGRSRPGSRLGGAEARRRRPGRRPAPRCARAARGWRSRA